MQIPKFSQNINRRTIITLIFIGIVIFASFLIYQYQQIKKELNEKLSQIEKLETQVRKLETQVRNLEKQNQQQDIGINTWKTYKEEKLGFSFKYPADFGDVRIGTLSGETGKKFYGDFTANTSLIFGGISEDFTEGRGGGFTDTRGYIEKDGEYYYKFVSFKNDVLVDKSLVKEINAQNVVGILVMGKNYEIEGPSLFPISNQLGALFNLTNQDFNGIAFFVRDTNNISQQKFEEILRTMNIF